MPLLQGCLYIGPVWVEPVDRAPEIISPEFAPDEVLEVVFQADTETFTVIAFDPEEGSLAIEWEVPHGVDFVETQFESDGLTVSHAEIPADPLLDGEEILCHVADRPAFNVTTVSWIVVVP